jgi:hypothetical protein
MATPGQPTSYKPEYDELVTRRAIQNWIATHPDFAEAVGRGRAVADAAGESMRHADNCAGVHPLGETRK